MSYYTLYKNVYGHNHENQDYIDFITKRYKQSVKNDLPEDKNAPILELGCANGMLLYAIKELGYNNLKGVEIDPELASVARSFELDIDTEDLIVFLNKDKNKYSTILMYDVLEHINKEDVKNVLNLIYDRLEYDGKLIFTVPNASSTIGSYYRYIDWTHQVSYTASSIIYVMQQANFQNIRIKEDGPVVLYDKESYKSIEEYEYHKKKYENYEFVKAITRWYNSSLLDSGKLNLFASPNLKVIATKSDFEQVILDVEEKDVSLKNIFDSTKVLNEQISESNRAIGNNYNLILNSKEDIENNKEGIENNKKEVTKIYNEINNLGETQYKLINENSLKVDDFLNLLSQEIQNERVKTNTQIIEMFRGQFKRRNRNNFVKLFDRIKLHRQAKFMIKHHLFDFDFYLKNYDFDHSMSAVMYFLKYGIYQGHNPRANFDVYSYVVENPIVVYSMENIVIKAYEEGKTNLEGK